MKASIDVCIINHCWHKNNIHSIHLLRVSTECMFFMTGTVPCLDKAVLHHCIYV